MNRDNTVHPASRSRDSRLLPTVLHTKAVDVEVHGEPIGGPTSFHLMFHIRHSSTRDSSCRACDAIRHRETQGAVPSWAPGACLRRPGENTTVFNGVNHLGFRCGADNGPDERFETAGKRAHVSQSLAPPPKPP